MHRARTAFNLLTPVGQQNFGSWLVRQQKSKVRLIFMRFGSRLIRRVVDMSYLTHFAVGKVPNDFSRVIGLCVLFSSMANLHK